jgi:hypothetical protein
VSTTRGLFAAILLGLGLAAWGNDQSQPPSPTPAKTTQTKEHQAKANEQPADGKVAASRDDPAENKAQQHEEKSSAEWWLVTFNGLLVVVVFLQWYWMVRQERVLGKSVAVAEKAATAAKESSESYKVAERAWVGWCEVSVADYSGTNTETGKEVSGIAFAMVWRNGGRTPAVDALVIGDHKIVPYNEETVPTFTIQPGTMQKTATFLPGFNAGGPKRYIEQAYVDKMTSRTSKLFLYGRVEYGAVFPSKAQTRPQTEVCLEVRFFGFESESRKPHFTYGPVGPQNSAR